MRIFRKLIALGAAALLTVSTAFGCIASAEEGSKHFSIIEAASNADSLSIPEIAKKSRRKWPGTMIWLSAPAVTAPSAK